MKKLTLALACASTLALFATDFSVATFEAAGLLGKTVGAKDDAGGTNGDIYWQYKGASGSEDSSVVTAYGGENLSAPTGSQLSGTPGDNYLNLSTEGGTLWRSVNPNASDLGAAQNIDDAKGLFIDTMVQFTATEDGGTPEIAQDENGNYIDKLAIWLAAEEGKAPALCVMGCAMTTEGSGRNEVPVATPTTFKLTGADIQAGTWYRLTVQAIKNIVDQNGFQGDFVSGFVVRIDGKPLSVAAPETVCDSKFTTYYEGGLAGDAAALIAAGQFIPSLTGYQNEDKSALQAVGFKGSGAIDDLKLTDENPITPASEPVPVTGVTLDKTAVTNAKVGDSITLVATVAPENATDKTVTWETSDAEVATVANGVVTILKAGTVTITAKAGEHSATCAITVKAAYPTYIGDDAAKQAKYDTWAGLYGADTESANEEAFLLNVAPAEAETEKGKFVITSITVGADGTVTVVAPAKNSKGAAFNGTVEVLGATALDGEWAPKATGHKFFKAVLK